MKMETAKDRLLKFLEHIGIGQNAFEKKVKIANGYISHNKGSIGSTTIGKIAVVYPDLNTSWLLTGDGEMLKTEKKEPPPVDTITMSREVFNQITRLSETVSAQQIERGDFLELLKSQQRTIETFARIEEKLDNREGAVSKSRNVL